MLHRVGLSRVEKFWVLYYLGIVWLGKERKVSRVLFGEWYMVTVG